MAGNDYGSKGEETSKETGYTGGGYQCHTPTKGADIKGSETAGADEKWREAGNAVEYTLGSKGYRPGS
jgi:hypothetical protein